MKSIFCIILIDFLLVNAFNRYFAGFNIYKSQLCTRFKNYARLRDVSVLKSRSLRLQPLNDVGMSVPSDMIDERTIECLDFGIVLEHLCNNTVTILGRSMCRQKQGNDSATIRKDYSMIDQLSNHIVMLPLRSNMNIYPVLDAIEYNLSPPEREDLYFFTMQIEQIIELYNYMTLHAEKLDLFDDITQQMLLPDELKDMFVDSFDDEGNLNAEKFPIIKKLRTDIENLRGKIIQTLKTMLQSMDMREKLADSGFTEIEGRYVIMLKNTYKKGVGIVHGSSNTGRSLYVEPIEIVEPTNEMKSLQAQLRAEEAIILSDMCQTISKFRKEIKSSTSAVAEIDIYRAKGKLGATLKGVIPEVFDEGCVSCENAKHPVLMLRGVDPVGNGIFLNETCKSWVISGPNAGGKTIILKTAGLFALMVRHCIPIPARHGCRVDMMYVMADIGDMQTVSGDLSTFSGHLVVCREMLKKLEALQSQTQTQSRSVASCNYTHSLVLLDEIGTGTDPAQGAALAQSILEELLSLNARVIVTTHYQRIKELAASDPRFRIAAMEFVENRPTYKLRLGSVGESFALEAAKRMNLPSKVLSRAELLLDDETRRIVSLQIKLEEETNRARLREKEYVDLIASLQAREDEIERINDIVKEKIIKLRDGMTEEFVADLKKKETDFNIMIQEAKLSILDNSGKLTSSDKSKIVNEMKTVIKQVRVSEEKDLVEHRVRGGGDAEGEILATPLGPTDRVEIGKRLVILEKGNLFGINGIVSQKDKGRGRIMLSVAGMEVKVERHLLGYPLRSGLGLKSSDLKLLRDSGGATTLENLEDAGFTNLKNMSSKDKRLFKMLQEELVDPDKMMDSRAVRSQGSSASSNVVSVGGVTALKAKPSSITAQRTASNTCDVRDKSLVEAQQVAMAYFEKVFDQMYGEDSSGRSQLGKNNNAVYLHIGKAPADEVKHRLVSWLKGLSLVSRAQPAESAQGGDAFIAVELSFEDLN